MSIAAKDAAAGVLTALAVFVFAAVHESWNVWLIGSNHRSAAAAILLLGMGACTLGSAGAEMGEHTSTRLLAVIGSLAFVFALWAIVTGSLPALALVVAADIVLWIGATLRHSSQPKHGPIPS